MKRYRLGAVLGWAGAAKLPPLDRVSEARPALPLVPEARTP